MMPQESTATSPTAKRLQGIFVTRAAIVVLVFTVAGLATLAKNGQYYPKSDPARCVSISTKMNVAHSPVDNAGGLLQAVSPAFPPQTTLPITRAQRAEPAPVRRIGLIVSMQHRSPPRTSRYAIFV